MSPKVSVFWLNYNSLHTFGLVKKSLDAIFELNYPDFELIIVDNGSTDGSIEIIKKYVNNKTKNKKLKTKIIRLNKNVGFSDGVNVAYKARNRKTKYVAIINNDAIPNPEYLWKLVQFLESNRDVGAIQGIIAKLGEKSLIDSAGFFADEVLNLYSPYLNKPINVISKPILVSCVEGTMPLYNVRIIQDSIENENIYVPGSFMYYLEDVFLSLMLWNKGYKSVVVPIVAGEHHRKATAKKIFTSEKLLYYSLRNRLALLYATNSKYKSDIIIKYLSRIFLTKGGLFKRKMILNALIDGVISGKQLREKYGAIDIHKVPLLKIPIRKRFLI
jgi:GT2 family glycosyltransferase